MPPRLALGVFTASVRCVQPVPFFELPSVGGGQCLLSLAAAGFHENVPHSTSLPRREASLAWYPLALEAGLAPIENFSFFNPPGYYNQGVWP